MICRALLILIVVTSIMKHSTVTPINVPVLDAIIVRGIDVLPDASVLSTKIVFQENIAALLQTNAWIASGAMARRTMYRSKQATMKVLEREHRRARISATALRHKIVLRDRKKSSVQPDR